MMAGLLDTDWKHTELSPEDEARFLAEFSASPFYREFLQRYKEAPDLRGDYDYRAWWQDGMHAERSPHDGTLHGPSKTRSGRWLKAPTHPTAWKQDFMEKWGIDPDGFDAGY
jgi:hypothetical protein